jgi:two-component system phosphate regulon sensor histidine kinase PhoR
VVLFVALGISFSASFLLFYFALEFLVFKEINELYSIVEKMKKKDFKIVKKTLRSSLSPVRKLGDEIHIYATKKQREIEELKKIEVYRREFLADVSHELKTPIFAAQGFLHTIVDSEIEDEVLRNKFLGKAIKALEGLNTMIQDLMTLSKMEAGFITMNIQATDLVKVVRDVFEQLEEQAEDKGVSLTADFQQVESLNVWADEYRIRHVFLNLIENAVKYGNREGHVVVHFQPQADNVQVSIEDDGPGIGAEHLERIFERFYRVEKSRSKEKGGTGLGLAIVKQVLEAHQSKIEVMSKKKKGTTFRFTLRRCEAPLPEGMTIGTQATALKDEA